MSEVIYHTKNKTSKFTYDTNGNILTKEEFVSNTSLLIKTDTYEYSNLNWQDQLTKFNDISITYDEIGNPTTIGDTNLTWNIRELQRYQNTMLDSQFFYNKEGIRTKKIVNGVETNYFLENSNILFEETKGNMLYYMRTDENDLIGFQYNNETYYYKKNYQGDILGIYNSNYELVCTYEYDSYGSIVSIKDVLGTEIEDENHIANINPYRYRSYYYDKETKLYYLNSRYYNPLWGRFINADGIIGTSESYLGYNLYAYCENNPIINVDSEGKFSFKKIGAAIKNGAKKVVQIATTMVSSTIGAALGMPISSSLLNKSMNNPNDKINSKTNKKLTQKVKESPEMKAAELDCLLKNKNSKSFTCSGSVNGNYGFTSSKDLYNSIGHASYEIIGTTNFSTRLINLKVIVSDTYDFDKIRKWTSFSNAANNFGYIYQNAGLLTPYSIKIVYDVALFIE